MAKRKPNKKGLDAQHLPIFYRQVYKAVLGIPFGEVRSYKWVAQKIGRPNAWRAVGQALRRNPWPFIIPCHRVVGSDRKIGGYSQGVKLKEKILKLERQLKELMV